MHPELYVACQSAVHVHTVDGKQMRAGRAALFILGELGFSYITRIAVLPPFIWCVELGYRWVARYRGKLYKWFIKPFKQK